MSEEAKKDADVRLAPVIVSYLASLLGLADFSVYRQKIVLHNDLFKSVIEENDRALRHFVRISREMEIVYRLAIFDALLSNITRYALAARPEKAVGQAQMYVGKLINSTKSAIINSHIESKVKSIGTGSFVERVKALQSIMGVPIEFNDETKEKLRQISRIRNEIVHTAGSAYGFSLDENMAISHGYDAAEIDIPDDFDTQFLHNLASIIYETFVVKFLERELHDIERIAVNGLRSDKPVWPVFP
jgi:hypothetical protein